MLMLMTTMKTFSPPTLLCKALSGWTLSRLLSPRSCNLQVLHALSKRNIIMRKLSVATEKASICVNNLIRDISSIFGCINNPPFFVQCQDLRRSKYRHSSCITDFFLWVSWDQSDLFDDGVEVKISSLQRNFWCYVPNYLDFEKIMNQLSRYVI